MLRLKRYPKRSPFWYVRGTIGGKTIFESTDTTTRSEAEDYRRKREKELYDETVLDKAPSAIFADAVTAYVDHGGEALYLDSLNDHFGDWTLSSIKQADIDALARKLYPKGKASTLVRQVYGPMTAVLNHAARAELEQASWRRIKKPKVDKVMPVWATDLHVEALAEYCHPRLRGLLMVMTYTGLRIGEMLQATAADFAKRKGWLEIGRTKNGEPAFVPLAAPARAAIKDTLLPKGPAFGYSTSQGVNKALRTAAKRAKLPYLSCHQVGRHTFAARMLAAGYDIKTVKEAGRWKKLAVVDESYGHLELSQAHDAMVAVGKNRAKSVKSGKIAPNSTRPK